MLKCMRKPNPLTNLEEDDQKLDEDVAKRLAKAFDDLQDLEE